MKWLIGVLVVLGILAVFFVGQDDGSGEILVSDDCILLGSAFYPGALISNDAGNYVSNYKEDLILFHFGDSVPWEILSKCDDIDNCELSGNDASAYNDFKEVIDNLALHSKANKKVYLAVNPINNERDGVATNWDSEKNLGYLPPGDDFNNEQVRTLYKKWVSYLVEKFDPDYLSQAVEFNMYSDSNSGDFDNLVSLLEEVKKENEGETFVIGPTIQWEFFKRNSVSVDWNLLGEGFAFSTYPHIFSKEDISSDMYDFSNYGISIDNKPLFISESGVSHDYQESLLEALFKLKEEYNLQAVIWFFKEDADSYFDTLPNEYPFTVFQNNGLYTDSGVKNPGAALWEKELAC